ncbi:MAG: class I SAM-dependent DNA methyltransferase [Polyangiales bacterium]
MNFIWGVADDALRDVYVRGKYRDVILPMTVIRRLDALLEPTKAEVLKRQEALREKKFSAEQIETVLITSKVSGHPFVNTSAFTLRTLRDHQKQLRANFESYLNGFSKNVREIIQRFGFMQQLDKLDSKGLLDLVLEKFTSREVNFSPNPVVDEQGRERLPGMSNHDMGYVFEELLRKFNEENNEEAGEHFTPREVVRLMASLLFLPVADEIKDSTYLVYDCACGSGGMLTEAEAMLQRLAKEHGKKASIKLYGQEVNDETYAICKADMLVKGEDVTNIRIGSTLAEDAFPRDRFDFMLANPPYGKSWKSDLERMGGKDEMKDPRFVIEHAGESNYSLSTRSSDGQLMFLVNMLAKMKPDTVLGSRVATIHNGSSLFTGDAGQGESNIRRWIIENDWLEAIIALPLKLFYNTGIATYVWVISNRKPKHRRGKVQLIDATSWSRPLRKNLGQKSVELASEDIERITKMFLAFEESECSKIFDNRAFGYWKVSVERPLRLRFEWSEQTERELRNADFWVRWGEKKAPEGVRGEETIPRWKAEYIRQMQLQYPGHVWRDRDECRDAIVRLSQELGMDLPRPILAGVLKTLGVRDSSAAPVIAKVHKAGKVKADPLKGLFDAKIDGKACVVEYESDSDLSDSEQVPLLEEGGVEGFVKREVLPHAHDAWVDERATRVGYEISFNRYFYKPQQMRTLEAIRADILAVHKESEGLLAEILGGGAR